MKITGNMWITVFAPVLIILGVLLLVLGSIPVENRIKDNTLTVKFVIGKKDIDIAGAEFLPVPDDVEHNIWRVNGTSIGRIRSGHFKNSKTGNRYIFYLTGKGDKVYFELDGKKYLVDNVL